MESLVALMEKLRITGEHEREKARARRKRAALAVREAVIQKNRRRQAEMSEDVITTVEAGLEECSMRTLLRIDRCTKNLDASSTATVLEAVRGLRELLAVEHLPPIAEVVSKGCLPYFVKALSHSDENINFEAAWALTNVASGPTEFVLAMLKFKAVDVLVDCLRSPSRLLAEQAIWALGNVAGDSYECRDYVLLKGALDPLLDLCAEGRTVGQRRNATWAVSNLFRGKPPPLMALLQDSVKRVATLLWDPDLSIARDAAWCLSYYTDGGDARDEHLMTIPDAVRRAVVMLAHEDSSISTPALRIIGNITTGPDHLVDLLLNLGVLDGVAMFLRAAKPKGQREGFWALSNITGGNSQQIQCFLEHDVFNLTLQASQAREDIAAQALWTLANATNGDLDMNSEQMVAILLALYSKLRTVRQQQTLAVCIEGISNIVKKSPTTCPSGSNAAARTLAEHDGLNNLLSLSDLYDDGPIGKAVTALLELCTDSTQ